MLQQDFSFNPIGRGIKQRKVRLEVIRENPGAIIQFIQKGRRSQKQRERYLKNHHGATEISR